VQCPPLALDSHSMPLTLSQLADRWKDAPAAERANAQSYLIELCHALGVEPPGPSGSGYEFEYAIPITERDGTETTNYVDCWKDGHFALEAKHLDSRESEDIKLRRAFGQAKTYVNSLPQRPPYLLVLDVGRTLLVWDGWSGDFGGFSAHRRIDLITLESRPDDGALLRDIWEDPGKRDPRARSAAVTKEIAAQLAELAASLEERGHGQEEVARFLIRVVFTMFAEDVGLLPAETFRDLLEDVEPAGLPEALEDLWRSMDEGRRFGGRKLARFNGHFFHEAKALPLTRADSGLLALAAQRDWADVEPSIFGTLLVRALDPVERHRLGAEFTPRAYVERLVKPTVEEPLRERWTAVQAEVLRLRESGRPTDRKKALQAVTDFHEWLCGLRFLDPACGSGNFLYVTLWMVKRLELEVRALENELRTAGDSDLRLFEVHPRQFHGIEIKPWAREITELTLWIGYHQFWRAHQHVEYPEPILEDTGTIECRDAVLAWDTIRHDPTRDRPDPTPRIPHPVTGELVPDPAAKLQYMEYVNARPAEWPQADFIVGNPPYLGEKRQREALGDGYVDALRSAYYLVSDSADLVMYWWVRAAHEVGEGRTNSAGLITTNTITQAKNRVMMAEAMGRGARIRWAVADHPWIEEIGGAAVRVAMTVVSHQAGQALLVEVDDQARVLSERRVPSLHDDLTAGVNVAAAVRHPLLANSGLSSQGVKRSGDGFLVSETWARGLIAEDARYHEVVRRYVTGRDLSAHSQGLWVIDFGLRSEAEAREYPRAFERVRDRVKPERAANKRAAYAALWWRFAEPRRELREALSSLPRYLATLEVSKHRFFTFLDAETAPDGTLVCVASNEAYVLGVLSSAVHQTWCLAAAGMLEDRPRYTKSVALDPFPFPDLPDALRIAIAAKAEQLDAHRQAALARDERVTMTGMYNVVEKLRSGDPLTKKEREIHEIAACGVLRDLHDELDRRAAKAYGWPWPMEKEEILERLVALHDERVAEEKAGKVRWLRPDYQIPRFGKDLPAASGELGLAAETGRDIRKVREAAPWPAAAVDQILAVKAALDGAPRSLDQVVAWFSDARPDFVERHLDTLAILGEARKLPDGRYAAATAS